MMYSPVFVTNFKKISNQIIIFGINLNFIPLEVRAYLFDKFITKSNFDNNKSKNLQSPPKELNVD